MDTIFSDVSEWQVPVDDSYPYPVLSIRSNDGTYRDRDFAQNYAWGLEALRTGRLRCLIVYCVWRENWTETVAVHQQMLGGAPVPGVVSMIDVESWEGEITGDHSDGINRAFWALADFYRDQRRVIGYGNVSDLDALWPVKPNGVRLVVAAYGSNPDYPGKLAHQFTNGVYDPLWVPPFNLADVNSADGYDLNQFCAALGLDGAPLPEDSVTPDDIRNIVSAIANYPIYDFVAGNNATQPWAINAGWGTSHAAFARGAAEANQRQIAGLQGAVDHLADVVAGVKGADPEAIKAAVRAAIAESVHVEGDVHVVADPSQPTAEAH